MGKSFKIVTDDYINIKGIGVRKIKVTNSNFVTLKEVARENFANSFRNVQPVQEYSTSYEEEPVYESAMVQPEIEEEVPTRAYHAIKEEKNIDLGGVQSLNSVYGRRQQTAVRQPREEVQPEVKEEEVITEDKFIQLLKQPSFSKEANNYKDALLDQYEIIEQRIKDKTDEIDNITRDYSKESELSSRIKEEKKDIQRVLNGMNTWQMDFFAKFKNEVRTKNLLDNIEEYFSSYRKDLELKIRAEKEGEARKEALGNQEHEARLALTKQKKQLSDFIQKEYLNLVDVTKTDEILKGEKEKMKSLTESKNTESLLTNSEKLQRNGSEMENLLYLNREKQFNEPLPQMRQNSYVQPDIPQINTGENLNRNVDNSMNNNFSGNFNYNNNNSYNYDQNYMGFNTSANEQTSDANEKETVRQVVSQIRPTEEELNRFRSKRVA